MKAISLLFIISLFIFVVFGVQNKTEGVTVNDGGSVTLHSHLPELQTYDVIVWRFKGDRIAKVNRAVKSDPVYDSDVRFTDRLKMNPQTGDLTITNITSEHTGLYQLEINGVISTEAFSVIIPEVRGIYTSKAGGEDDRSSTGQSSGVIAGICVALLLLVMAAAAGVVIYRHRTTRPLDSRDEEKSTEMHLMNGEASNGVVDPVT